MPQPQEILNGLSQIVNQFSNYAIIWHVVFYILIILLISQWKTSNKLFSVFLAIPLLSVSLFAWLSKNPFNGLMFALFGLLLFVLGLKNSQENIVFSPTPFNILGILVIIYGLVYPHFALVSNFYEYLFLAPTGLIPCPTLSVVIGFTILFSNFQSRRWAILLLIIGFFYSLFGIFRLGVWLDLGLLAANCTLLIQILFTKKPICE
jgi:hypothetical protein